MRPKRPTAVTVLGILNIVFSSLGLISNLCCGVGLVVFAGPIEQAAAKDPNVQQVKDVIDVFARNVPYFVVVMSLGTILSVLLLVGGIGLLRMRSWARVLCILVAVAHICFQAGNFAYNAAVIQPDMNQAVAKMAAKQGQPAPPANPFAGAAGSGCTSILGVAYYIVLLIFMLQPRIAAAFRQQTSRDVFPEDEERLPRDDERRHDRLDDRDEGSTAFRGD